ncbi:hypothetical protein VSR68_37880 [Paraburkholderia phymatum]|uniref:hypothetical protein n=1 Tax=Paraburkholderia phymatum TaxID=148447 RepID=UPI003176A49E
MNIDTEAYEDAIGLLVNEISDYLFIDSRIIDCIESIVDESESTSYKNLDKEILVNAVIKAMLTCTPSQIHRALKSAISEHKALSQPA